MARQAVRVGLIGLGKMGQNHLRVLAMLNSVQLVFIYDTDRELLARLAAANGVAAAGDLTVALQGVDAVVICTPTSTHADYAQLAAPYVKSMLVEKPLADTLAASQRILALTGQRGIALQVGFIERFNPAVQQVKRILDQSGDAISADFTRTNKISARITDVDVVIDLMIHDIDLAMFLNGPVRDVNAHGVAEGGVIDFASAMLTHANGRFSRIQASRVTEKKIRAIQVTCRDMFIDCDLLRKEIIINKQSEVRLAAGEPYVITAVEQAVEVKPQEALLSELQAFAALCRGDNPDVPTGAAACDAMRVCEQIQAAILR